MNDSLERRPETFQCIGGPIDVIKHDGVWCARAADVADQFGFSPKFRRRFRRLMASDFVPLEELLPWLVGRASPRYVTRQVQAQLTSWRQEAFYALAVAAGLDVRREDFQ